MYGVFPGECDRCGGPRWWTFDNEDNVWVKCQDDECIDPQMELPLDSEFHGGVLVLGDKLERPRERGVPPPEGGDTERESNESVLVHIGVPLKAVLHDLWTGGPESCET